MSENRYILVIGAANIDIGGTPYSPLIAADSNPGNINISSGGVGRNIAHNLIRLGMDVKLMTAVGGDPLGKDLLNYCVNIGMDTSCSLIEEDYISSIYLYINDHEGDMQLALSDMDVCSRITPEYIDQYEVIINESAAVVADCNLSAESLIHIKQICKVPLFIDTVSVKKSAKIKNDLHGIYAVKPNILEAEELSEMEIRNIEDCIRAAERIIDKGAEKVFISMGADGILAADADNIFIVSRYDTHIINTTGAGDASTAAIVFSMISDQLNIYDPDVNPLIRAAQASNAAASLTLESNEAVNNNLNSEELMKRILKYKSDIKIIKENGIYL